MEETLLDAKNFVIRFGAGDLRNACVVDLHALLERINPGESVEGQTEWLEDLARWLFQRGPAPGLQPGESRPSAQLRFLLDVLDAMPQQKERLQMVVARVFSELNYVRLFTDTGLPAQTGFVAEAWERVVKNVLPEPPVERDAARLLYRLFPSASASRWFDALAPAMQQRLFETLAVPQGPALEPVMQAMRDAAVLLSLRVAESGTADDVRERCLDLTVRQSPFLQLPLLVRGMVGAGEVAKPLDVDPGVAVREGIGNCRKLLRKVLSTLDRTGISINLVYRLEYISRLLDRLYAMLSLLAPPSGTVTPGAGYRLLQTFIRGGVRDRGLTELFRTNSRLLASRVIERAGRTGEHYITSTRGEQHQMVSSAAGGGALTGIAVVVKLLLTWAHLPVLIESLAIGFDYAGAFVTMQLTGATLATKQPSMTAAALAHSIKETGDAPDVSLLVDQVVRTVRSQLAAIVGNLGMVMPVVIGIDLLWRLLLGHHVLDAAYATTLINKHHPLTSGTMVYAALTGVYLWLASVLGGTIENWCVVQKLPEAIATNRSLRALIGRERAGHASEFFTENIAGLGGNISFGFILALLPMLAGMVGLPLEVRHVTFATGQLAFAGLQRGAEGVLHPDFLWALGSIAAIGALNFGVSFGLALFVAFRARDVHAAQQVRLLGEVFRRFRARPLDFIRAPADANIVLGPIDDAPARPADP